MNHDIKIFATAIEGMVAYAKSIGFNPETDDFDKLATDWISHSKKLNEDIIQNQDAVMSLIKKTI